MRGVTATKLTPETMQELVFHVDSFVTVERFSITMTTNNAPHDVRFDFCVDGGRDVMLSYVGTRGQVIQPLVRARYEANADGDFMQHARDIDVLLPQCSTVITECLLFIRRRHAMLPCGSGTLSVIRDIVDHVKNLVVQDDHEPEHQ